MRPSPLERLIASGWARTWDGTAVPRGGAAFVRRRWEPASGPLVHLGCGTGVWLEALARAGVPAVGVDSSRENLDTARRRLAALPAGAVPATLVHGDMREFEAMRGLGMVLLAAPAMAALSTTEERRDTLDAVRKSLGPRGLVVVALESLPERVRREVVEFRDPATGAPLRRATAGRWDRALGRRLVRHAFSDGAGVPAGEAGFALADLSPEVLREDLRAAGLAERESHPGFAAGAAAGRRRRFVAVAAARE